ncbi:MAG: hypothetical protein ACK6CT_07625 [Planctomycetia bacterium]
MTWSVAAQNHLLARSGVAPRWLLWIGAKQLTTLAAAPVGLWSGADDLTFTIAGQSRVYNGALSRFDVDPISYSTGLDVRTQNVTIAANSPEVADVVRGFVVRLAPVELHLALFDPASDALIDEPEPMWRGFLNASPITTAASGGTETVTFGIVSRSRVMALPGPGLKKTDASIRRRNANEEFRQYGSIAKEITTKWLKD